MPAGRRRFLFLLAGAVLLLFVATLPWQRRLWQDAARIEREASLQEARAREIQTARAALDHNQDLLRRSPDNAAARFAVAAALVRRRDFRGAAGHLRVLENQTARSAEASEMLAGLYQQIGYLDRALAMARRAQRLDPASPAALLRLAHLCTQLGWRGSGNGLFRRAVALAPDAPEPHLGMAFFFDQAGDLRAAERELSLARRLRPRDWQVILLAARNLQAQQRYDAAERALEAALAVAPEQPELYAQRAGLLLDRARRNRTGGRPAEMAPVLRAALHCLDLDPDNADARFFLGSAYLEDGRETEAEREWERVFERNPGYAGLRLRLGRLLVRRGEQARGQRLLAEHERAQKQSAEYNRLVIIAGEDPENVDPHRRLARWCLEHGRFSRAILEWNEVLLRLPQDREAQQGIRVARQRRGDDPLP